MLKQARVEDVANRRITRLHGLIVVVTHYYPRFLKRMMIDEYIKALAPTRELLTEFKDAEEKVGDHDLAFDSVNYESKFWLEASGFSELKRIAEEAKTRDVYLVCHCKVGQRCHREILMVMAHVLYQAPIAKLAFSWEGFRSRL